MKIFTPIYNEMPWTPFFLRHLLEYDCPIVIAEGAADTIQNRNERSSDGSLELIREFADQWSDRVELYYHNRKLIPKDHPFGARIPKWHIKYYKCWETLKNGELMLALAPDNYYTTEDIAKLKKIEKDPEYRKCFHICTFMRVFIYSFEFMIEQREPGLCGPWYKVWPCIYRKNPNWVLVPGSEILMAQGSRRPLISPGIQNNMYVERPYTAMLPDIVNYHYKGVKLYDSRLKRFGGALARRWHRYPLRGGVLKMYDGPHPKTLDDHPWRDATDCRVARQRFNWKDFLHLVQRR
jgi:hypothetical protein